MTPKTAILIDFDGTITVEDVAMRIYGRFASPACAKLNRLWAEGSISTLQELEGCFATITASREVLEECIRDIPFDPGFDALVALSRERDLPMAVVSDGLDWYIEYLLDLRGDSDLPIYANHVEFTPEGPRFTYPWYDSAHAHRGVSKPGVIQQYQAQGYRVVFVGDGLTDTDAARAADILFAKEALWDYCARHSLPAVKYDTLEDVVRILRAEILSPAGEGKPRT